MTTAHNSIFRPVDEQLAALRRGAAEIISEAELRAKLEKSRATGKPLRVKLGVDPTAPDLHLGHTVVLRKLKHFQDEGHTAVFLIGDFTAMVGDPTGQSETRPPLTSEQVRANAKTYLDQVYKILDPERTEVRYNSEWLGALTSHDMIRLCAHYRLARMLEREDFRTRLAADRAKGTGFEGVLSPGSPSRGPGFEGVRRPASIFMHELLYPLLQAYDSVALQADVELGATEQKFNLLVGRDILREYGHEAQVALTMPVLFGTDGVRKMSKSLGNYIGISEASEDMFGKIMSISDELMWSYYELVTDFSSPVIVRLQEEVRTGVLHPMDAKKQLAHSIVANFHGEEAARQSAEGFRQIVEEGQVPAKIRLFKIQLLGSGSARLWYQEGEVITQDLILTIPPANRLKWAILIAKCDGAPSRSAADQLLKFGSVDINGETVTNVGAEIALDQPATFMVKVGKRNYFQIEVVVE